MSNDFPVPVISGEPPRGRARLDAHGAPLPGAGRSTVGDLEWCVVAIEDGGIHHDNRLHLARELAGPKVGRAHTTDIAEGLLTRYGRKTLTCAGPSEFKGP